MDVTPPLTIDESRPEDCFVPDGTRRVKVNNPERRPIDRDALEQALATQKNCLFVRELHIDWNSRLQSMSIVRMFPNLEAVSCASGEIESLWELVGLDKLRLFAIGSDGTARRSLEVIPHLRLDRLSVDVRSDTDADFIGACRGPLSFLSIDHWRQPDFRALASLQVKRAKIIDAMAVTSAGINCDQLAHLWFGECGRLSRLEGIRAPQIWIEACNQLDLDTLESVQGLRALRLTSLRNLKSFDFLHGCRSLDHISLTATRIPIDRSGLIESASLKLVFLSRPLPELLEIGAANPRLILGNGDGAVANGKIRPAQVYENASRTYFESLVGV